MESESSFEDEKPAVTQEDFATENKTNMWDNFDGLPPPKDGFKPSNPPISQDLAHL